MSAPSPTPHIAAFFDLDNTIVRGACVFLVGRGAVKSGYISFKKLMSFAWQQFKFVRFGENIQAMKAVQDRALQLVDGLPRSELVGLLPTVYRTNIEPRIWFDTVQLIKEHQAAGHDVWVATASPSEVADLIVDRLHLTGSIATNLEVVDDFYTGNVLGKPAHGPEKARRVKLLAETRGYDLSASSAYSDSVNDLPLLEAVGNPVAVNPDRRLRGIARTRGWQIRDLSKRTLTKH